MPTQVSDPEKSESPIMKKLYQTSQMNQHNQ